MGSNSVADAPLTCWWEGFFGLEVLFERNATCHDGGELHIVHSTAAGVRSKILFHNLFCDPADAGGQTGYSSSIYDCFNKLVV